jgi:hypothetical protein
VPVAIAALTNPLGSLLSNFFSGEFFGTVAN